VGGREGGREAKRGGGGGLPCRPCKQQMYKILHKYLLYYVIQIYYILFPPIVIVFIGIFIFISILHTLFPNNN
jgi:hypothetical protein